MKSLTSHWGKPQDMICTQETENKSNCLSVHPECIILICLNCMITSHNISHWEIWKQGSHQILIKMNGKCEERRCYGAEPAASVITTESSVKVGEAMAPPPSVLKPRVRAAPFCMSTTAVGKLRTKNQVSLATCLGMVYEINDLYLFK